MSALALVSSEPAAATTSAASSTWTADMQIFRQFDDFLRGLEEQRKPTFEDMIEAVDRIENRIAGSQRALVSGGINGDFVESEGRDCLTLRSLIHLLWKINEHKAAIGPILRGDSPAKRKR